MPLTSSTAFRELTDLNVPGTRFGQTTTDVIGFYGVTTCVPQFAISTAINQSISSGALASTIAFALNRMGLINISTILP